MTSKTAYKKFKLRFNRLDSNFSDEISTKDFCEVFNKAQYHYLNNLLAKEETNKETQTDLQVLLRDSKITGILEDNKFLVPLPDNWYWIKRVSCKDTKCENTLNCILIQESNVGRLLQNDNWRPSVEWEETFFTLGNHHLRIYVDNFRIKDIQVVYYKEPIKIDIKSGLDNIEGILSQDVDPEWTDNIVEQIIDLAVLITSSDLSDNNNFSSKAQLKQLTV